MTGYEVTRHRPQCSTILRKPSLAEPWRYAGGRPRAVGPPQ